MVVNSEANILHLNTPIAEKNGPAFISFLCSLTQYKLLWEETGTICSSSEPRRSLQVSADHTASNWRANSSLRKNLSGNLCNCQRPNWQQPKCLSTAEKLNSAVFLQFSSVQFSRSVMSDSLQPHELQHTRPLCPSPTPRVHSDSRPSSQ